MPDILYQCAKEFEKVSNYNYIFAIGKNGKTFQLNMNCLQENFTHIVGLDHLLANEIKRSPSSHNFLLSDKITFDEHSVTLSENINGKKFADVSIGIALEIPYTWYTEHNLKIKLKTSKDTVKLSKEMTEEITSLVQDKYKEKYHIAENNAIDLCHPCNFSSIGGGRRK